MRVFILVFAVFIFKNGYSQEQPTLRQITVTGSAEMLLPPDEITLEIVLREYGDKFNKTSLEKIESKFFKALQENGISKDRVHYANKQYYWYYWWTYRNHYFNQKTYQFTLQSDSDFLSLMESLDQEGIYSVRIADSTNKSIHEMRKEVKIQALKAAKDKASYMLESIGESLGPVVTIEELPENNHYYWRQQNVISNVVVNTPQQEGEDMGIPAIKLRYEVKTIFEIQ